VAPLLKFVNLVAHRPGAMPPHFGSSTLDGRPLALNREHARAVGRHAEPLSLTFPLALDPGKINALYGVIGLPTSLVVAQDGRAVAFGVGPHEWGSAPAHALLGALLAEPVSRVGAR
jgi:hypothetical protein